MSKSRIAAMSVGSAGRERILLLSSRAGVARNRNRPTKDALRRIVRKPSFSYSGLPRSVANSVTVAPPTASSTCPINARPSPRRP
jgi:hypothetical protein